MTRQWTLAEKVEDMRRFHNNVPEGQYHLQLPPSQIDELLHLLSANPAARAVNKAYAVKQERLHRRWRNGRWLPDAGDDR